MTLRQLQSCTFGDARSAGACVRSQSRVLAGSAQTTRPFALERKQALYEGSRRASLCMLMPEGDSSR